MLGGAAVSSRTILSTGEARKCLSSTLWIAQDHHGVWGTLPGSAQVARNYKVCFHQVLRQHPLLQNSPAAWAIFAVLKEREVIHVPSIAKTHLRGTVLGASGICCNTFFFLLLLPQKVLTYI